MSDQENPTTPPTPPNRRSNNRGGNRQRQDNRRGERSTGSDSGQHSGSRWRDPRSFRSVREREEQETGTSTDPQTDLPEGARSRPEQRSQQPRQENQQNRGQGSRQGENQREQKDQRGNFRAQPKRPLLGHLRQQDQERGERRERKPRSFDPNLPPEVQSGTSGADQPPGSPEPTPRDRQNRQRRGKQQGTGRQQGSRRQGSSPVGRTPLQPKRAVDPKTLRPTLSQRALKSLLRGPKRIFKPGKVEFDPSDIREENAGPQENQSDPTAPVYRSLAELMEADRQARGAPQPEHRTTERGTRGDGRKRDRRQQGGRQQRANQPSGRGTQNRQVDRERLAPSIPIPTDRGIKARSPRGSDNQNWWARRWIEAMENIVDAHRLQRGRTYARDGQVLSIEESPYGVEARVQGSRREPYKVTFQLTPLTDEQWEQVIDALAEQARFTAQLLAGEMPDDIETAFEAADVSLFPQTAGDLYTSCSCPDWANPCKHVAATHYILGDRFDDDPFLLFRMRGRTQEQILDALRRRRSITEVEIPLEPPQEEIVPPPAAPPAPTLETEPNAFWTAPVPLESIELSIRPPAVDMPVLKRMGEPAFLPGKSLQELLAPVYQSFTYSALRAAYSEETPVERGSDDEHPTRNGSEKDA